MTTPAVTSRALATATGAVLTTAVLVALAMLAPGAGLAGLRLSGALGGMRSVAARARRRRGQGDDGLSTLEVVVIALGLFLIAGVVVAAITAAVNSRVSQIN